jgi:hypothetical protein
MVNLQLFPKTCFHLDICCSCGQIITWLNSVRCLFWGGRKTYGPAESHTFHFWSLRSPTSNISPAYAVAHNPSTWFSSPQTSNAFSRLAPLLMALPLVPLKKRSNQEIFQSSHTCFLLSSTWALHPGMKSRFQVLTWDHSSTWAQGPPPLPMLKNVTPGSPYSNFLHALMAFSQQPKSMLLFIIKILSWSLYPFSSHHPLSI